MLFQSDYWVACNYAQKLETILDFLYTDKGIENLIIIDKTQTLDTKKILTDLYDNKELPCKVTLIAEREVRLFEEADEPHKKTIYVRSNLDEMTINLLKTLHPILAIFV